MIGVRSFFSDLFFSGSGDARPVDDRNILLIGSVTSCLVTYDAHGGSTRSFPGGPTLNLAKALAYLGNNVKLISHIGDDDQGRQIISTFKSDEVCRKRIDLSLLQVINDQPTTVAKIHLDKNGRVNSYTVDDHSATDHISNRFAIPVMKAAESCKAVCYGTLMQRDEGNRKMLIRMLQEVDRSAPRYFDVNFRNKDYNKRMLEDSYGEATVVQINQRDMRTSATVLGWADISQPREFAARMVKHFPQLNTCIITLGAKGAVAVDNAGGKLVEVEVAAPKVPKPKNSLGTGGQFAAAFLDTQLKDRHYDLDFALKAAVLRASCAVTLDGPLPTIRDHDIEQFIMEHGDIKVEMPRYTMDVPKDLDPGVISEGVCGRDVPRSI